MRMLASAFFGFGYVCAAFALVSTPVSAVEAPAVTKSVNGWITKVEERDHERCERIRRECRERHGDTTHARIPTTVLP